MLRIAVCDDNRPMLDYLCDKTRAVLKHNSTDFEIIPFIDAEKLLESCRHWKYDIFLLDICMPNVNGFDIAKAVRDSSSSAYIVFITSNETLVFESFDYQPFYFIRKTDPLKMETELEQTLKRLLRHMKKYYVLQLQSAQNGIVPVTVSNIIYIESCAHYLYYYTFDKDPIATREKISDVCQAMESLPMVRVHKSYIVNLHSIKRIEKSTDRLIMKNNAEIQIGRAFRDSFFSRYAEFMKEYITV